MAIVTAWWGIWHIVAGMTLAFVLEAPQRAAPRPARGRREPRHDGPPRTRHGACGYLGRQVSAWPTRPWRIARPGGGARHPRTRRAPLPGVVYEATDIRDPRALNALARHRIDTVVHLASIVTPGKDSRRDFEYDVDVNGTRNLLQACVQQGVQHRGVVQRRRPWLPRRQPGLADRKMPVRGNEVFAHARKGWWKKCWPSTATATRRWNQVGCASAPSWAPRCATRSPTCSKTPPVGHPADSPCLHSGDRDVVDIYPARRPGSAGHLQRSGRWRLTIHEIAQRLGKPTLQLPAGLLLQGALALLKPLGLTQHGPEQLDFLRYRPVLLNTKLKTTLATRPPTPRPRCSELSPPGAHANPQESV